MERSFVGFRSSQSLGDDRRRGRAHAPELPGEGIRRSPHVGLALVHIITDDTCRLLSCLIRDGLDAARELAKDPRVRVEAVIFRLGEGGVDRRRHHRFFFLRLVIVGLDRDGRVRRVSRLLARVLEDETARCRSSFALT